MFFQIAEKIDKSWPQIDVVQEFFIFWGLSELEVEIVLSGWEQQTALHLVRRHDLE